MITITGYGCGSPALLTRRAREAIESAATVIGAPRLIAELESQDKATGDREGRRLITASLPEKMAEAARASAAIGDVCVLVTGDVGFFSAARSLVASGLGSTGQDGMDDGVELICGVSSIAYFAARLRMSWEDMAIVSLHAAHAPFAHIVNRSEKTFLLSGGPNTAERILCDLAEYGLGELTVHVGEDLSYESERVTSGKARDLAAGLYGSFSPLSVLIVENPGRPNSGSGIRDSEFIRGDVPMTKEEVRFVSVGKLAPTGNEVVYDVGAGTGSVAIEMARRLDRGKVYAIERDAKGLALIEANKRKFAADNVITVEGSAPGALAGLPAPDKVFIGGSGGAVADTMAAALSMNPNVSFVINTVSLEGLMDVLDAAESLDLEFEATQLSVARSSLAGSYHLMRGNNPVFVITAGKHGQA